MRLEPILERLDAADQAPWHRHGADVRGADGTIVFRGRDGESAVREQADRDAELIAHCREDLRALLAEVEALRAALPPAADALPAESSAG